MQTVSKCLAGRHGCLPSYYCELAKHHEALNCFLSHLNAYSITMSTQAMRKPLPDNIVNINKNIDLDISHHAKWYLYQYRQQMSIARLTTLLAHVFKRKVVVKCIAQSNTSIANSWQLGKQVRLSKDTIIGKLITTHAAHWLIHFNSQTVSDLKQWQPGHHLATLFSQLWQLLDFSFSKYSIKIMFTGAFNLFRLGDNQLHYDSQLGYLAESKSYTFSKAQYERAEHA